MQLNKRVIEPAVFLDLNRVAKLHDDVELFRADDGYRDHPRSPVYLGPSCRHSAEPKAPPSSEIVSIFGSPQIRHVGTIGGNIINASPIADSLPFLFVIEAELELVGPSGIRRVNINDFYQGYKNFDLRPDELLARVVIPMPRGNELLRLYKISPAARFGYCHVHRGDSNST